MNGLLRWLTSMTEAPQPCQSSSSSRTCSSTGSGSVAGPAAKLNTRTRGLSGSFTPWGSADLSLALGRRGTGCRSGLGHGRLVARLEALDTLDADEPLALAEADQA